MQEKELLKSNREYGLKMFIKKAAAGVVIASFALGSVLGSVSCGNPSAKESDSGIVDNGGNNNEDNEQNNNQNQGGGNQNQDQNENQQGNENQGNGEGNPDDNQQNHPPIEDNPPVDDTISFEEFLTDYKEEADTFALDLIDGISHYENSLSTSYSFVNEDNKIAQILVANVVKTGETQRELKITTINIVGGIDVNDIVEGATVPTFTIDSETALSFDAKEECFNENSTIHTQIDDIIKDNLGVTATEIDAYEKEIYQPEINLPGTVAEMVEQYGDRVNEVLNEYFLDDALKNGRFSSLDSSLVHDAKWYLNGQNEIESLDFAFHYGDTSSQTYYLINLDFDKTATINDILNNQSNLSNIATTRTQTYFFNYNQSIQGTRDELMNAIFETYGMGKTCPEGAIRLFKDDGNSLSVTLGEVNEFVVAEITNSNITKFKIRIKRASNDTEYMAKLLSSSNFAFYEEEQVDLNGQIVTYSPTNSSTVVAIPTSQNTVAIITDGKKYLA